MWSGINVTASIVPKVRDRIHFLPSWTRRQSDSNRTLVRGRCHHPSTPGANRKRPSTAFGNWRSGPPNARKIIPDSQQLLAGWSFYGTPYTTKSVRNRINSYKRWLEVVLLLTLKIHKCDINMTTAVHDLTGSSGDAMRCDTMRSTEIRWRSGEIAANY